MDFSNAGFHATRSRNVNAPLIDESVLTDGKIDPMKLRPIAYDTVNNTYYSFGEVVGKAFEAGLSLKQE